MIEGISGKIGLLLEANYILSSTLDLNQLLNTIMNLAAKVVDAEVSSLMLLDETGEELSFQVALGEKGSAVKQIRLKLGEGIAGWVAKEGEPLIIKDVAKDPRWAKQADAASKFVTRSIICVPLKIKEKIIGVMECINHLSRGYFDQADLPFLQSFASQAAIAIENARLFQTLKLEKEKIETIFNGMSDGAIFTDGEGNILMINQAAGPFFNSDTTQLLGQKISSIFNGFDAQPAWEEIFAVREDKYFNCQFSRKEGKSIYLSGLVNRLAGESNAACGYIFILRDITDEYKENMLKHSFISLVSHKLRTPLTTINGYLSLLYEEKSGEGLAPFSKKAVSSSLEQTKLLTALVNQLLNFTVIEGSNLELKIEKVAWDMLVKEIKQSLTDGLLAENIQLNWLSVEGKFVLALDLAKTKEIFHQIFDNAIKFNRNSIKQIDVSCRPAENNKFLQICVSDNGKGIPPEEREKIFQKFYQIEEYFTGQIVGAGLGLALVKRLVEEQGGKVWVESRLDQGSKFFFTVPMG
ncbi:MAG: ATP-binding protein [Elusimicrobiota bacterium]